MDIFQEFKLVELSDSSSRNRLPDNTARMHYNEERGKQAYSLTLPSNIAKIIVDEGYKYYTVYQSVITNEVGIKFTVNPLAKCSRKVVAKVIQGQPCTLNGKDLMQLIIKSLGLAYNDADKRFIPLKQVRANDFLSIILLNNPF